MLFFQGFFKLAIYAAFFLLTCNGSIRRTRGPRFSTPAQETNFTLPELSQRFECIKFLPYDISYFRLNVTLNTSAILRNAEEAVLVRSSTNNTWHYLENMFEFYPQGNLVVEFTLYFNKTPKGDCQFSFNETTSTKLMTIDSYTKTTTPTPFNKTSTRGVSTTPKFVTTFINKTVKTTTTTEELTNVSTCLCPCKCTVPVSKQNSDEMMAAMLEDMRIPKFMTSFSKRKLTSAPDNRLSVKGIGVVGTFVMTIVFGIIVIGDVKLFLANARTAYTTLRGRYSN